MLVAQVAAYIRQLRSPTTISTKIPTCSTMYTQFYADYSRQVPRVRDILQCLWTVARLDSSLGQQDNVLSVLDFYYTNSRLPEYSKHWSQLSLTQSQKHTPFQFWTRTHCSSFAWKLLHMHKHCMRDPPLLLGLSICCLYALPSIFTLGPYFPTVTAAPMFKFLARA